MRQLSILSKLPVFPPVATRLMRMLYNEKVSFQQVGALVGSDVALTAEVLRMANSPLMGAASNINSLNQAMVLVGIERLNALVLTVSLCKFVAPAARCRALAVCWRHSLATATVAEKLAFKYVQSADAAYTAGILHDIGRLALLVAEPAKYDQLLRQAEGTTEEILEKEWQAFGMNHCEAGQEVVTLWGFPEEFAEYTRQHHEPKKESRVMTQLVYASCGLADMLGFQVCGAAPPWNPESLEPWLPAKAADDIDTDELKWRIADRINSLDTAGLATVNS
jgi:putative nucleotidyltransferase with HDIG domain